MTEMKLTERVQTIEHAVEQIRVAREKDELLHLELYCEGADCPARTIQVHVKDYDKELLSWAEMGLSCPVCGRVTKLHHARTAHEHHEIREAEARCSVNIQRWVRDNKQPDSPDPGIVFIPGSVMADDSLPK